MINKFRAQQAAPLRIDFAAQSTRLSDKMTCGKIGVPVPDSYEE